MLDFIANMSPWWWVAFALALGAVEMATMSFFLIWPALAALLMAGVVVAWPDLSGAALVAIFAILAIGLTFLGRSILVRFGDGGGPDSSLNSRSKQLIGRRATVLEWNGGDGIVEIDSIRWKAVWEDTGAAETDGKVNVTKADGMVLTVRND